MMMMMGIEKGETIFLLYLIFETGERAGGGKPQKYLGQMCSAEHHLHHHVYHPYSRHRHHYHDYHCQHDY